jgi:hypothetical protein
MIKCSTTNTTAPPKMKGSALRKPSPEWEATPAINMVKLADMDLLQGNHRTNKLTFKNR